jgi:hypothetical protein
MHPNRQRIIHQRFEVRSILMVLSVTSEMRAMLISTCGLRPVTGSGLLFLKKYQTASANATINIRITSHFDIPLPFIGVVRLIQTLIKKKHSYAFPTCATRIWVVISSSAGQNLPQTGLWYWYEFLKRIRQLDGDSHHFQQNHDH